MKNYNITAFSTALFSTWINIEELNLLLDAGDGVSAGLLQKSRKIKYVFVTHPDRDHLNGLYQFIQLNTREDYPIIHYPKDSGSFPAIKNFLSKFDPHVNDVEWLGIEDRQIINIKKGFEVEAIRNEHIPATIGIHKSLSYKIFETKTKLKSEFQKVESTEIKRIVDEKGRDYITEKVRNNIISFSGEISKHAGKHSTLEEVLKMVSEIKVEKLMLTHFSARYSNEYIDESIRKLSKEYKIDIPIYVVYPGEIKRDILSSKAVNS